MPDDAWTIKRVLDFATDYFTKAGIENPHLEAEILLAHALNMKRIELYIRFDNALSKSELSNFKGSILRRKSREPAAYIIGNKSFMSLDFLVTKDVLIPRPETEALVEEVKKIAEGMGSSIDILEIGTGSGAVAVSLAKYTGNARIHATDISEKAVLVARTNAQKHGVSERISFEVTDLFPNGNGRKFDIIVSNPPYVPTKKIGELPPEIRDFEPLSALDGGEDGLEFYRRIIGRSPDFLKENGVIVLEIDPVVAGGVKQLAAEAGFPGVETRNDLNALERTAVIYRRRRASRCR